MTTASVACPVCHEQLQVRSAVGRKSNKPFLMLVCAVDGRHFRGFIADKNFVDQVISSAEGIAQ